ncbi:Putative membrane protein [Helicobacter felis]|uniref:Membrane protein n=1 Tax=Helicobacter felis (strain ATCC 49179 / CCUG 28539 / NCTC 12436 / CS1) TaxID=936155 RepID=E7AC25_HELFC|nr:putative membrane protein [Helicobacter felis ATCC 49179]
MFLNNNVFFLRLGQVVSGAVVSLLTFSSTLAGK